MIEMCDNETMTNSYSQDPSTHQLPSTTCSSSSFTAVSRDMLLPNVFVRIPSNQLSMSLPRRPMSREEIKAELPIKSEMDGSAQSQHSTNSRKGTSGIDSLRASPGQFSVESTSSTSSPPPSIFVTARPKVSAVKCLKCELCPFMSITQDGINSHMKNVHENQTSACDESVSRKKIQCPGCENVFYTRKSLKIHLAKDHQMSSIEISPLVESLFASEATSDTGARPKKGTARKQKIYLRNVEVLKNPRFATDIAAQDPSNYINSIDSISDSMRLNDPHSNSAFGQIDHTLSQLQSIASSIELSSTSRPDSGNSVKYAENMNESTTEWQMPAAPINSCDESFRGIEMMASNVATWDRMMATTTINDNIASNSMASTSLSTFGTCQNERKKIFIKNIDILKEPLMPRPSMATASNVNETPTTTASSSTSSTSGRKHMLHLRTVDEVNLMLSNKVPLIQFTLVAKIE